MPYTHFHAAVVRAYISHMSSANKWVTGDDVEIMVPSDGSPWPAVVVRVGSDTLHLRLSNDDPTRLALAAGSSVVLRRVSTRGLESAETELTQSFEGIGPHLLVRRPTTPELLQRRGLFRIPTALPLTIQIKRATRSDWESNRAYHHLTADASGSGCSIETEIPLEPGDRLRVTLWPDRPSQVIAGARVVWTGPSDWPGLRRVGLSFTNISTTGQDRLVGTLMEEERVRRRVLLDA